MTEPQRVGRELLRRRFLGQAGIAGSGHGVSACGGQDHRAALPRRARRTAHYDRISPEGRDDLAADAAAAAGDAV